jgi:hypothetical protein
LINDAAARRAIDGDPGTSWDTERYNTRDFGRLKSGVGLILQLDQAGFSEANLRAALAQPRYQRDRAVDGFRSAIDHAVEVHDNQAKPRGQVAHGRRSYAGALGSDRLAEC